MESNNWAGHHDHKDEGNSLVAGSWPKMRHRELEMEEAVRQSSLPELRKKASRLQFLAPGVLRGRWKASGEERRL